MYQQPEHIMDLIPQFREVIEHLEKIKLSVIKESDFDYNSQDARMVALDSLQVSISAGGDVDPLLQFFSKFPHTGRTI